MIGDSDDITVIINESTTGDIFLVYNLRRIEFLCRSRGSNSSSSSSSSSSRSNSIRHISSSSSSSSSSGGGSSSSSSNSSSSSCSVLKQQRWVSLVLFCIKICAE